MIYELRIYKVKSGSMDEWVKLFEDKIIPENDKAGIPVRGYFRSVEDEDTFVWIRGFEDEADRQAKREIVYNSELWLTSLKAEALALLEDTSNVTIIEPGALSLFK